MKPEHMLKEVKVQDAIGLRLGHDLTRIVPGEFKGRAFRKGHIITEQDIPELLDIGKEHIYILDIPQGWVHEDDAAARMAMATAGDNIELTPPAEGKITLKSTIHGLAKIDAEFVNTVNAIEHVVFSTILNNTVVQPGTALAATRVVPLIVEEHTITEFEQNAAGFKQRTATVTTSQSATISTEAAGNAAAGNTAPGLVHVKEFRPLRAGVITTGSEVFNNRITDKFGPVLRDKLAAFGSEVIEQRFSPDVTDTIVEHIRYFQEQQADLILVTGGMSVDPDDRTPGAIKKSGADIISYGNPMLPGSMLMMAYLDGKPILGLPGAVMHEKFTSFDVLLPRICAGERIDRRDIIAMGYGGLLKS